MNEKVYVVEQTYSNGDLYDYHREHSCIRGIFKTFGGAQNKINQIRKGMMYGIVHSPDGEYIEAVDNFGEMIDGHRIFYTTSSFGTLALFSRFGFRDFYCWNIAEWDLN